MAAQFWLQAAGGEIRALAYHAVHRVQAMRDRAVAVATNRVAIGTQLKRFRLVQGTDGYRRRAVLAQELSRRCAEQSDRGDVVCYLRAIGAGTACTGTAGGTTAEVT